MTRLFVVVYDSQQSFVTSLWMAADEAFLLEGAPGFGAEAELPRSRPAMGDLFGLGDLPSALLKPISAVGPWKAMVGWLPPRLLLLLLLPLLPLELKASISSSSKLL